MVLRGALTAWRKRQKTKIVRNYKKCFGETLSPTDLESIDEQWDKFKQDTAHWNIQKNNWISNWAQSDQYRTELINMTTGMNTPSKADPMFDLVKNLNVREKELDAYIKSITEEKNRLSEMQKELSVQQEKAERDLMKVQRAKAVLRDDEEPVASSFRQDAAYGSDIRIGEKGV